MHIAEGCQQERPRPLRTLRSTPPGTRCLEAGVQHAAIEKAGYVTAKDPWPRRFFGATLARDEDDPVLARRQAMHGAGKQVEAAREEDDLACRKGGRGRVVEQGILPGRYFGLCGELEHDLIVGQERHRIGKSRLHVWAGPDVVANDGDGEGETAPPASAKVRAARRAAPGGGVGGEHRRSNLEEVPAGGVDRCQCFGLQALKVQREITLRGIERKEELLRPPTAGDTNLSHADTSIFGKRSG